ncbi:MAG: type II toxin-antitoxin system prevent-host-death family antitoxin [Candidatus Rokubacteria bacterium]|nr:type II toxin-antitoxin system prevent-host-death family antitoxin [Candidatus Rokubacteria bacterium]
MKQVKIAELKARLSEYLRAVRAGETITVLDRETPIAHIVPARERPAITIRKPAPGTPPLHKIKIPKGPKLNFDIVELLLEDRRKGR